MKVKGYLVETLETSQLKYLDVCEHTTEKNTMNSYRMKKKGKTQTNLDPV